MAIRLRRDCAYKEGTNIKILVRTKKRRDVAGVESYGEL
jgi:hypothetical protein